MSSPITDFGHALVEVQRSIQQARHLGTSLDGYTHYIDNLKADTPFQIEDISYHLSQAEELVIRLQDELSLLANGDSE